MFFLDGKFLPGCLCRPTLKSKKTLKTLKKNLKKPFKKPKNLKTFSKKN